MRGVGLLVVGLRIRSLFGTVYYGKSRGRVFFTCNFPPLFSTTFFVEWTAIGIEIGHGSEVRIEGGRIIGVASRHDGSIGIHCTGNNGGVHIDGTDVIALETGLLLDDTNGKGSNREIFITQATFDSDNRGIAVKDNSYISVAGIWAASSDTDQIWIAPDLAINLLFSK